MRIIIDDMVYGRMESQALRMELISLRDKALDETRISEAILLSHTIAWMSVAIEQLSNKEK